MSIDPTKQRFTNTIGQEFVYIPPGSFMMGSPIDEPGRWDDEFRHRVTITKGFYLQTTPVTQGQWVSVMQGNPSQLRCCGDDFPVENVSWNQVQRFIQRLNAKEGTDRYRLPTEAEWEYACRAGTETAYYTGDDEQALRLAGWYWGNSDLMPHAVGQKQPNAWGLYDMHGNVWEWVADRYGEYPRTDVIDPTGYDSGQFRVIRGGCWIFNARFCRSAHRSFERQRFRSYFLGFRLARSC